MTHFHINIRPKHYSTLQIYRTRLRSRETMAYLICFWTEAVEEVLTHLHTFAHVDMGVGTVVHGAAASQEESTRGQLPLGASVQEITRGESAGAAEKPEKKMTTTLQLTSWYSIEKNQTLDYISAFRPNRQNVLEHEKSFGILSILPGTDGYSGLVMDEWTCVATVTLSEAVVEETVLAILDG